MATYKFQTHINPHNPIEAVTASKQYAMLGLALIILPLMVSKTYSVSITEQIEHSKIYPGLEDYTLEATLNEVL